jgi:hypothetical protein
MSRLRRRDRTDGNISSYVLWWHCPTCLEPCLCCSCACSPMQVISKRETYRDSPSYLAPLDLLLVHTPSWLHSICFHRCHPTQLNTAYAFTDVIPHS